MTANARFRHQAELDQYMLTEAWERIHATRKMVGAFSAPGDPDALLFAMASDSLTEQSLHVQLSDGSALYVNERPVVYVRRRSSVGEAWGPWGHVDGVGAGRPLFRPASSNSTGLTETADRHFRPG
jgi:hypothetical protein